MAQQVLKLMMVSVFDNDIYLRYESVKTNKRWKEMLDELKIGGDMWLSAIKLAVQAGSHIYKNKQKTKMQWQMHKCTTQKKMAKGETEYQGKLLEVDKSDWKDEFVLFLSY